MYPYFILLLFFKFWYFRYLQNKTMISTAAMLVSRAFTEEHCPFFRAGRLITTKQMQLAHKPSMHTVVSDMPWTPNSKYCGLNSSGCPNSSSLAFKSNLLLFSTSKASDVLFIVKWLSFCGSIIYKAETSQILINRSIAALWVWIPI